MILSMGLKFEKNRKLFIWKKINSNFAAPFDLILVKMVASNLDLLKKST
jgi:hypothetical protein